MSVSVDTRVRLGRCAVIAGALNRRIGFNRALRVGTLWRIARATLALCTLLHFGCLVLCTITPGFSFATRLLRAIPGTVVHRLRLVLKALLMALCFCPGLACRITDLSGYRRGRALCT